MKQAANREAEAQTAFHARSLTQATCRRIVHTITNIDEVVGEQAEQMHWMLSLIWQQTFAVADVGIRRGILETQRRYARINWRRANQGS
ncbi:hypothetical protein DOTSEDRAFT_68972 [Dothistroma septosporum NZE10]|uniref:Uncharacterized protein n=1 Tax=Dothistroma septosporum (strain NZE10 / CBS 128990) TaxID=675120 RepID=N1Q3L4_DOTSN|nr:hypothetical protein DOTSEDRAFT_68972 [Dothistroma septosporum NZE10]